MVLSSLAKHFNDEETYIKLQRLVNSHNKVNTDIPKVKPKLDLDKRELDKEIKRIEKEIEKTLIKNGFKKER